MRTGDRKPIILIIWFLLMVFAYGCGEGEEIESGTSVEDEETESSIIIEVEPSDYFPTSEGTSWVYEIEIGNVEPIFYRLERWSVGDGYVLPYEIRGRFARLFYNNNEKKFLLEIGVKRLADKQGPLQYPKGVELEIKKDELGIFEEAKQVFWAITFSGGFEVDEVVTYSPENMPGYPTGSWGMEEGYSIRPMFFSDLPGTQIGICVGDEAVDNLLFAGVDTKVPEYEGIPLLYFIRTVEPAKKKEGENYYYFHNGFSEEIWFAIGKGLVRLEQKVGGKTSMVWTLVEFSEGTD